MLIARPHAFNCFSTHVVGLLRYDDAACILVHKDLLQFISVSRTDTRDDGVVLFLHSSKTDQTGAGAWVAIGATRGRFCPVRLLRDLLCLGRYVRDHPSADVGPLLRDVKLKYQPHRHHILQQVTAPLAQPIPALSYTSFLLSIQHFVEEAGIPKHVSLHAAVRVGHLRLQLWALTHNLCVVWAAGKWAQLLLTLYKIF
jgi:hypothetical protein